MKLTVEAKRVRAKQPPSALPVNQIIESDRILNPLRWAGVFMERWEILMYDRVDYWEACFFRWGEQHEHLTGDSLEEARGKAEQRIQLLEYGELEN